MAEGQLSWDRRERPILEALYSLEEEGAQRVSAELVAERAGVPKADVARAFAALIDAGYFSATVLGGDFLVAPRLHEKARREIGQWPADSFDAFVAALEERIATERDPEARTRLQRVLDAVTSIGRDVVTDVLAAALKRAGGI